jgi:hypothetical protein
MEMKEEPTVSFQRRAMGIGLIVFAVLIMIRVHWLGTSFWLDFAEETRDRFFVLHWFSVCFALIGCWVAFRSRPAKWASIVVFVAGLIAIAIYDYFFLERS